MRTDILKAEIATTGAFDAGIVIDARDAGKSVRRLVNTVIATAAVLFFAAGVVLYFIDFRLFFEIISFVWRVREAIFALAISLLAAWLIGRKTQELGTRITQLDSDSTRMVQTLRSTLGATIEQMHERIVTETKTAMNEGLGGFRPEVERIVSAAVATGGQAVAVKQRHDAKPDSEAGKEDQQRKAAVVQAQAQAQAKLLADRAIARRDRELQDEYDKNWGEMRSLWEDVWTWTRDQLTYALENDKRGVVIGNLRTVPLQSPVTVIEMLWRYGYYGDRSSDLAIVMAGMFSRYRTKIVPVDAGALREFKTLHKEWLRTND